jgi:hypothetical protein
MVSDNWYYIDPARHEVPPTLCVIEKPAALLSGRGEQDDAAIV